MGVPLDIYRARIGSFNSRRVLLCCSKNDSGSCLLMVLIPLAALCLLLQVSGVELNPGPQITCRYCQLSLESVSLYYEHVKVHKFRKNFLVPCFYQNCSRTSTSLNALQIHITRFHRKAGAQPSHNQGQEIQCSVGTCRLNLDSCRLTISQHMGEHLLNGQSFTCPIQPCTTVINSKRQLQTHLTRYHSSLFHESADLNPPVLQDLAAEPHQDEPACSDLSSPPHLMQDAENISMGDSSTPQAGADPFPEFVVKDEIARFYLKLEGEYLLPSSTVQSISEEIKVMSELSHHRLKRALHEELSNLGLGEEVIQGVVKNTFKMDPVFNMHHKGEDVEHLGTYHMREQYMKKHFSYVEPQEIFLGLDERGKKRNAHYVSIKQTLSVLLKDERVKTLVSDSFNIQTDSGTVLKDFTDGTAFKSHVAEHPNGKCLQILLFQDAFEFNPFGPAKGLFKPVGFYYSLGNLPPAYRSKVDLIQLAYMILEKDLKPSVQQDLNDQDVMKEALKPLLDELRELKHNGIDFDGEKIPVCLLFCIGDSLGQHQIGGFVRSFSAEFFCRFCPVSKTEFQDKPSECFHPLRTPQEYDEAVENVRKKWLLLRRKSILQQKMRVMRLAKQQAHKLTARSRSSALKKTFNQAVSKAAYTRLCSLNYKGVKFRPSPLNCTELGFHVCSPALPPCLAHDLFEGIVKVTLARILSYFIIVKEWFDLPCLNRRIKAFKCKGLDARDSPTPLKSLEELTGNCSENWNLLRLLPFMISDLIEDKNDKMWELYLSLKEIVELVCAPQISMEQVAYLKLLIRTYLAELKILEPHLPSCLTPKQHFLSHYPDLIAIFGPLIRLFTLRYESKHVFFKKVARACKNYINITYTLARKHTSRFASDHSSEILPSDVQFNSTSAQNVSIASISEDQRAAFPPGFSYSESVSVNSVKVRGVEYQRGCFMVLALKDSVDLTVGCIRTILVTTSNTVLFVLEENIAVNTFQGYYSIQNQSSKKFILKSLDSLPDYYPLSSYDCERGIGISLKHSLPCMM